jgi:hypothetical protein
VKRQTAVDRYLSEPVQYGGIWASRERLGLTQPALGVVLARIRNAYAEAHR